MPIQYKVLGILAIFLGAFASSEPGEIPLNSPEVPVGAEGTDNIHWYQQESLNGERYKEEPPNMPDPIICNQQNSYLSCNGKELRSYRELYEFPGLVYVMLYIEVDERIPRPWRFALKQVRELNRTFQRSGVPAQFLVAKIKTVDVTGLSITRYLDELRGRAGRLSRETGADLVIGLLSPTQRYSYCGLANVGTLKAWPQTSVTACYNKSTLAHEVGHSFGLRHDKNVSGNPPFVEGGLGYKVDDSRGTVMAYARKRVPYFSSPKLKIKNEIYGDEYTDAVTALKDALGNIAMAHERMMKAEEYSFDQSVDIMSSYSSIDYEIEYCE